MVVSLYLPRSNSSSESKGFKERKKNINITIQNVPNFLTVSPHIYVQAKTYGIEWMQFYSTTAGGEATYAISSREKKTFKKIQT